MNHLEGLRERIHGPVFSIVTPFLEDGRIDFGRLEAYIGRIYSSGGRIFYVMAYNSRFSELSWPEIKQLNEFVVTRVKEQGPDTTAIVADPLHCPTSVSQEFCSHAEAIGADLISLIFREKFYTNEQVIAHYRACASATDIGLLVHEMPFISGLGGHTVKWPLDLLDAIADIDRVVAIKEDAKEDHYTAEVISLIKDRLSIVLSGGGKRQWLRFADAGCQAWLNGIGVFEPRIPGLFYDAYLSGDDPTIRRVIDEVEIPFFEEIVHRFGWHLGIKAALEVRGIMLRAERLPMLPVPDSVMPSVEASMGRIEDSMATLLP